MKRRIVILEPWRFPERALQILRELGEVTFYNEGDDLSNADILVVRLKFHLSAKFLKDASSLKIISTATTGLDHIDLAFAAQRGIEVLSLRGETKFLASVTATAEHAWGLLLALFRHIPRAHQAVVSGTWDRNQFFGRELQNRRLGIVGLGRIGRMVAQYGLAFRMKVSAYDPFQADWTTQVERAANLIDLVKTSDVLSIHVPLNDSTRHLINRDHLENVKPEAVIINTSRGAILDQDALLDGLEQGRIAGAAIDVVEDEYHSDSPAHARLIRYAATHDNLLITPHLGGATFDSLEKVELFMASKLAAFLTRAPV